MNSYWPFINPYNQSSADIPLLRESFPNWSTGDGIFGALESLPNVTLPWDSYADSDILDIEYFGNRSGGKFSAPVVMNLLGNTTELLDSDRAILAKIIWTKFREPWTHLWETNVVAYNPIHNYDMEESRSMNKGESSAVMQEDSTVDSTQHGRTTIDKDFAFGLNNTNPIGKPANRYTSEEGGTTQVTENSQRKNDAVKASNEVETTHRAGNIGVTTTQAMILADRQVWLWNFFDQVYKDIDSVLALPFYDACRI